MKRRNSIAQLWDSRHHDPEPWWYSIATGCALFGAVGIIIFLAVVL